MVKIKVWHVVGLEKHGPYFTWEEADTVHSLLDELAAFISEDTVEATLA